MCRVLSCGEIKICQIFCDCCCCCCCCRGAGVDFQTKTLEVGGRVIALQLWDTAGQERSVNHHHHHYSACTMSVYSSACYQYSLHSDLSKASSIASSKVRLCRDRSLFKVAIQEVYGRPTGLLQSL